ISCGGNSGSQASTLIVQAMALGEVTIKDWWRVMAREIKSGALLGLALTTVDFLRIAIGQWVQPGVYDGIWLPLGLTIAFLVLFSVLCGSLLLSILPIVDKIIVLYTVN